MTTLDSNWDSWGSGSTFTICLKDVLETVYGTTMDADDYEIARGDFSYNGVEYGDLPILPDPKEIGLGSYPIFHEDYRPILNGKIVDYFWNREIGQETIDEWKRVMRIRMQNVMPYYNKLYLSEEIPYEPLQTMDIHSVSMSHTEGTENVDASNETTSETDSKARAVSSTTPQTQLAGMGDYASEANDSNSNNTSNATSDQNSLAENETDSNSDNRVTGFQGISSDLMMRYRNSLLNIDTMVMAELEDCFMLLLNNGDAYIRTGWAY